MNSKQVRWLVLAVVVVLAVVTGVIVATKNNAESSAGDVVYATVTVPPSSNIYDKPSESSASSAAPTTSSAGEAPPSSSAAETTPSSEASAPSTDPAVPGRKGTNIPMVKLKPGEQAPQFVIFSFDGVGSSQKMHEFLDAAAPNDARFTGFLTGLYVIDDAHSDAYQGPGADRGSSEVGFGGDTDEVIQRVNDLNQAYMAGNEIGTHYNGHFCGLGANWSTAEWDSELDQFYDFMTNWKTIDNIPNAPDLVFPPSEVKGGRTPCLAGQIDQLTPAWLSHNMTYDSSLPAPRDGIFWPEKLDGVWEFYMPQVYSAGLGGMTTAMDYNFWYKFNQATEQPDTAPQLTKIVYDTYNYMYNQAYNGNRAPVLIANHFNNWNGNSFNPATAQFMSETCGKPDTYCATYSDVIKWMELQDPQVLSDLQSQNSVAYQP